MNNPGEQQLTSIPVVRRALFPAVDVFESVGYKIEALWSLFNANQSMPLAFLSAADGRSLKIAKEQQTNRGRWIDWSTGEHEGNRKDGKRTRHEKDSSEKREENGKQGPIALLWIAQSWQNTSRRAWKPSFCILAKHWNDSVKTEGTAQGRKRSPLV